MSYKNPSGCLLFDNVSIIAEQITNNVNSLLTKCEIQLLIPLPSWSNIQWFRCPFGTIMCHHEHEKFPQLISLLWNNMAAILADDIYNCIFLNGNDRIPIHISLKYVSRSPIRNKPALVNGLVPNRLPAITLTNNDPVHWRIYAALEGHEIT